MSTCHRRKAGRKRCRVGTRCHLRHHATSRDIMRSGAEVGRERKRVGSGWRKMSFDRRRCGRETRWRERKRKRKTGDCRKRKGFPLQHPLPSLTQNVRQGVLLSTATLLLVIQVTESIFTHHYAFSYLKPVWKGSSANHPFHP